MPYIAVDNGRYLGEHSCGKSHYGNMDLVRDCCLVDYLAWETTADKVALTASHPARKLANAAWNALTYAEQATANRIRDTREWENPGPVAPA